MYMNKKSALTVNVGAFYDYSRIQCEQTVLY